MGSNRSRRRRRSLIVQRSRSRVVRGQRFIKFGCLRPCSTSTFDCFEVSNVSTVIHTVLQSLLLRARLSLLPLRPFLLLRLRLRSGFWGDSTIIHISASFSSLGPSFLACALAVAPAPMHREPGRPKTWTLRMATNS